MLECVILNHLIFSQDFPFVGSSGSGGGSNGKVPPLIREFLSSLDDKEWQAELYKLLQNQSFNQVEVDLFELLCKVLDHNLFAQVDWARNSYYFKELKVSQSNPLVPLRTSCLQKQSVRRFLMQLDGTLNLAPPPPSHRFRSLAHGRVHQESRALGNTWKEKCPELPWQEWRQKLILLLTYKSVLSTNKEGGAHFLKHGVN